MKDTITFTPESFLKFKRAYEECPDEGTFIFEGREVLKGYAKYMIQYVESKL